MKAEQAYITEAVWPRDIRVLSDSAVDSDRIKKTVLFSPGCTFYGTKCPLPRAIVTPDDRVVDRRDLSTISLPSFLISAL